MKRYTHRYIPELNESVGFWRDYTLYLISYISVSVYALLLQVFLKLIREIYTCNNNVTLSWVLIIIEVVYSVVVEAKNILGINSSWTKVRGGQ